VRIIVGKLFASILLTLCIGIHVLEASGHWDQTFQDANDEAVIVAVILCVGVAVAAAGARLSALRLTRIRQPLSTVQARTPVRSRHGLPTLLFAPASPPPLPLRV
jgi:hypothetical protein